MPECTCIFRPPKHSGTVLPGGTNKYAIYLDEWEDDSEIDPKCPFHGDEGSQVVKVFLSRKETEDGVEGKSR